MWWPVAAVIIGGEDYIFPQQALRKGGVACYDACRLWIDLQHCRFFSYAVYSWFPAEKESELPVAADSSPKVVASVSAVGEPLNHYVNRSPLHIIIIALSKKNNH